MFVAITDSQDSSEHARRRVANYFPDLAMRLTVRVMKTRRALFEAKIKTWPSMATGSCGQYQSRATVKLHNAR